MVKTEAKKAFSNSAFLHHQGTHLIEQRAHIFPSPLFVADVLEEALFVIFDIPGQILFHVVLSPAHCIASYSDNIPVFFPSGLSLFPHFMDLSLPPEFC